MERENGGEEEDVERGEREEGVGDILALFSLFVSVRC